MLNELAELEQYTAAIPDPDADKADVWAGKCSTYTAAGLDAVPQPLRYDRLADNLSGIRRAMTIVARGVLNGDPARLDYARDCLRLWCGHVSVSELAAPDALQQTLDGWLPKYLRLLRAYKLNDVVQLLAQLEERGALSPAQCQEVRTALQTALFPPEEECSEGAEVCKTLLEKTAPQFVKLLQSAVKPVDRLNDMRRRLSWRRRDYQRPALQLADESESDLYAVTFDAVLADALDQGPLRRRALVSTKHIKSESLYADVWMNSRKMSQKFVHFSEWERQLMKLTAMVLLTRLPGAEKGYPVPFSLTDADHYIGTDVKKKGICQRFGLGESEKTKLPIFTLKTLSSGVCMLDMSDEWLQHGGWKIVDETELEQYPGALYYADGDGLQEVKS